MGTLYLHSAPRLSMLFSAAFSVAVSMVTAEVLNIFETELASSSESSAAPAAPMLEFVEGGEPLLAPPPPSCFRFLFPFFDRSRS